MAWWSGLRRSSGRLAAVAAALAVVPVATGQSPPQRTVRDGVFSVEQVARGERAFARVCADCHEIAEFTGVGAYFERAEGDTVWKVFDYIWAQMPEDAPSSLEPEQYAAVLAYLLGVYGLPAGPEPLPTTPAALRRIVLTGPEQPGS